MFDGDEEAIAAILQGFVEQTHANIVQLQKAAKNNNFAQAQQVCHKMLPMFLQVNLHSCAAFLSKMDALKNGTAKNGKDWL
jgi:hypothetical protein